MTKAAGPWERAPAPLGVRLLVLFFLFGMTMSGLAAALLLVPGGSSSPLWRINPRAMGDLASLGAGGIVLMLGVCLACGSAAVGLCAPGPGDVGWPLSFWRATWWVISPGR